MSIFCEELKIFCQEELEVFYLGPCFKWSNMPMGFLFSVSFCFCGNGVIPYCDYSGDCMNLYM